VTAGFFSPLPPARSGVADYSSALLAALRKRGRVEVAPSRCDVALYHLGNNRLHSEIYDRALHEPGVVVLHDAVLHHFMLGRLHESAYIEEFVYNYGEWNRGLARELWRSRGVSGTDSRYFEHPMIRRACETARAVVVHNAAAAAAVRRHAASEPVVEIPHLWSPPARLPGAADALRWRASHGIGAGAFVFGVFGYLRESKRLLSVLSAFDRVHAWRSNAVLLVAGAFVSSDLERAAAPLLARPGIVRVPYLEDREFWTAAAAIDSGINLRWPAAGETSGIAVRMMGLGKPVVLTESLESASFPADAAVRVPGGPAEVDGLYHAMVLLLSVEDAARTVGERAAHHIRARHSAEAAADQYWKTLCEYSHRPCTAA
jgi:glycosyltransferase involved in cell wall biosynthesis